MINKKLALYSFRNITAAGIYIFLVSQIMRNGDQIFGRIEDKAFGPFAFLLLFVLSAAVVGSLVFGQATYYFFDNRKKDSIFMIFYSIGWLFVMTLIVLGTLALVNLMA